MCREAPTTCPGWQWGLEMASPELEVCLHPPNAWRTCYVDSRKPCNGPDWVHLGFHGTKDSTPELQQEHLTFTWPFTLDVLFITLGARDQHHRQQQHPNFTDEGKTQRGQQLTQNPSTRSQASPWCQNPALFTPLCSICH